MALFKPRQKAEEAYRFADMHCHLLPGMDDGSQDEKMTLELLRIAAAEGIDSMILTPHYIPGRAEPPRSSIRERTEEWNTVCEKEGIQIRLYPGSEFYFAENADRFLERHNVQTLNGTNRLLVEFPVDASDDFILESTRSMLGLGYVPVLAHIERYHMLVGNKRDIWRLKDLGAELQVNAASLTGRLGSHMKRFLFSLLDEHLIDYIGTDAHHPAFRPPYVRQCLAELYKKIDKDYAEEITYLNTKSLMEP